MIETNRLSIRRTVVKDWKEIQAIWTDAATSVFAQYDKPNELEARAVCCRIAKWASFTESNDHMFYSVCLRKHVIGYVVFHMREGGYEMSYCFHSAYHGQGYAKESISGLLAALKSEGISRITVGTAIKNTPSVRLLNSLGFQLIGTERVSFYKDTNDQAIFFDGGMYELNL